MAEKGAAAKMKDEKIVKKVTQKAPEKKQAAHTPVEHKAEKAEHAVKAKEQKPKAQKKAKTEASKKLEGLKRKIAKKNLPVFRGRFGKKWLRKKSIKKWQKWRYPKGIDISIKKEDGALPGAGYRTSKEIRFLHPSALTEFIVRNANDVLGAKEFNVIRIHGQTGKRKRKAIYLKAKELGLKVLNRGKI